MGFWFCSKLWICKLLQNIVGLRLVFSDKLRLGDFIFGLLMFFVLEFQFDSWILRLILKIKVSCSILNQMGGFLK